MPVFQMDQHIATFDMLQILINYLQDEPEISSNINNLTVHVASH